MTRSVCLFSAILASTLTQAAEFTAPYDGSDATPALNLVASALCASETDRTLHIPYGRYVFLTPPAAFNCGINLIGEGKNSTRLVRGYSGQGGLFLSWVRGSTQGSGSIKNLSVLAGNGTSGGIGVYVKASKDEDCSQQSFNRHNFTIDEIIVGREVGNGYWDSGIYLDGADNPEGTGCAPGIRGTWISHTSVAVASTAALYLYHATAINAQMECYTPAGPGGRDIVLNGYTGGVSLYHNWCAINWADSSSFGLSINGRPSGR